MQQFQTNAPSSISVPPRIDSFDMARAVFASGGHTVKKKRKVRKVKVNVDTPELSPDVQSSSQNYTRSRISASVHTPEKPEATSRVALDDIKAASSGLSQVLSILDTLPSFINSVETSLHKQVSEHADKEALYRTQVALHTARYHRECEQLERERRSRQYAESLLMDLAAGAPQGREAGEYPDVTLLNAVLRENEELRAELKGAGEGEFVSPSPSPGDEYTD